MTTVSQLIIYCLAPVVMFYGWYRVDLSGETIVLPLIIFAIYSIICVGALYILQYFYPHRAINYILSFSLSSANSWYFGIPMLLALAGEKYLPLLILCIAFILLYENIVWFYLTYRTSFKPLQALQKVAKLPWLYALILWIILNLFHVTLSVDVMSYVDYFRGGYIVLGMMIIGMGIASISWRKVDRRMMISSYLVKFAVIPSLIFVCLFLYQHYISPLSESFVLMIWFLCILPMPWNAIALAVEGNNHPEEISVLVFLSTLLWFVITPLLFALGGMYLW